MTKEDLSFFISLASMMVASLSLGWNIYREIILKARLKIKFSMVTLLNTFSDEKVKIRLSITNMGPGKVICDAIYLKNYSFWKKIKHKDTFALLMHDFTDPFSATLPKQLEVGENASYYFSPDKDCFLAHEFTHIGVCDSFGRFHWTKKRDFYRMQNKFQKTLNIDDKS